MSETKAGLDDLARRAIGCKRWRWVPGMLTTYATRVHSTTRAGLPEASRGGLIEADPLPALDDPATIGCLLALVREAWSNPTMHARSIGSAWCVWSAEPGAYEYATEAEALIAALEVAP